MYLGEVIVSSFKFYIHVNFQVSLKVSFLLICININEKFYMCILSEKSITPLLASAGQEDLS